LVLALVLLAMAAGGGDPLPLARDVRTKRFMTAVVCATCHATRPRSRWPPVTDCASDSSVSASSTFVVKPISAP